MSIVAYEASLLDINEQAVALTTRMRIPERAKDLRVVMSVPSLTGRKRKTKTAKCKGYVIRETKLDRKITKYGIDPHTIGESAP